MQVLYWRRFSIASKILLFDVWQNAGQNLHAKESRGSWIIFYMLGKPSETKTRCMNAVSYLSTVVSFSDGLFNCKFWCVFLLPSAGKRWFWWFNVWTCKRGPFWVSDLPTDKQPVRENWVLVLYSYVILLKFKLKIKSKFILKLWVKIDIRVFDSWIQNLILKFWFEFYNFEHWIQFYNLNYEFSTTLNVYHFRCHWHSPS